MPLFYSNNSEFYNISFHQINLKRLRNQDFVPSFIKLVSQSEIFNFELVTRK